MKVFLKTSRGSKLHSTKITALSYVPSEVGAAGAGVGTRDKSRITSSLSSFFWSAGISEAPLDGYFRVLGPKLEDPLLPQLLAEGAVQ